jgi:hypothetical protein
MTSAIGVVAGRSKGFFACGRAEETVYFVRCGGFAATTNEKDSTFYAAAAGPERSRMGRKPPLRCEQPQRPRMPD